MENKLKYSLTALVIFNLLISVTDIFFEYFKSDYGVRLISLITLSSIFIYFTFGWRHQKLLAGSVLINGLLLFPSTYLIVQFLNVAFNQSIEIVPFLSIFSVYYIFNIYFFTLGFAAYKELKNQSSKELAK